MSHDASIMSTIDDPRTRALALKTLARDGVVVLPTDTLYGFSARLSAEDAVRRITAIKSAPNDHRYILLAASIEMVERFVRSFGCVSRATLDAMWPAPLSVVLPAGPACPPWVGPTVAIRVPALPALRELIDELGEPIVSTSVNRSGQQPLEDVHEIRGEFSHEIDLIVPGPDTGGTASTLVDLCGTAPVVVRCGGYAWPAVGGGKPSK